MAIEKGDHEAMYNFGNYYDRFEPHKSIVFYESMFEKGFDVTDALSKIYSNNGPSLKSLNFYHKTDTTSFNQQLYWIMSHSHFTQEQLEFLSTVDEKNITNSFLKQFLKMMKDKIDLIELHEKFTVEEIKTEFYNRIERWFCKTV